MIETLNPRLDVVFKLLFAAESNRGLLVALLNDVLQPTSPIASVEVVNPEIEKDAPDDRGVILDILVIHGDGTRIDIEMQAQDRGATEKRALYHWARMYRDGIGRGDDFSDLNPCRVIFFLSYRLLPGERLHSTFRALEVHDGTLLSDGFEVHTIELPKLAGIVNAEDAGVLDWARFFAADDDAERRRVAMENPVIEQAYTALEELSRDPKAQALARWREDQLRLYRVELATAERRGRMDGLKEDLRAVCEAFDIELTNERIGQLESASLDELIALRDAILSSRAWPK